MSQNHSYEEIHAVAIDILAGREKTNYSPTQYTSIEYGIAEVFQRREQPDVKHTAHDVRLSPSDANLFMEVFWDLFRQNLLTIGSDRSNNAFPHCRLSHVGKKILANQGGYFFHDLTTFEAVIRKEVPSVDDVTLLYAKEAMQAFRSGCILSATVMLGVAAEHAFFSLLEVIEGNSSHQATFAPVKKERSILPKMNRFWSILSGKIATMPADLKEDLETRFLGIQSLIRTFRNEAGHPTGKIVDREQVYVLLNLFVPYLKKLAQLSDHFTCG